MSQYYEELLSAFVRGRLGVGAEPFDVLLEQARSAELRISKFKRDVRPLARVTRVLGALHGLVPESLLDVGSGRGAFLWPLLDRFPSLPVHAIDRLPQRVSDLEAAREGGVERLSASRMDVTELTFEDSSFDGATALEVLEHLENPSAAAKQLVRVARRFVVTSVPAKEDDNPEHIQLFTAESLTEIFMAAGARRVSCDYVLNHLIAVVMLKDD